MAICSDRKPESTSAVMTAGDEKLMRLTYLVRRTCDQLSRDLMTHTLMEFHSTDWETFANDPNCRKDFMKYFKHRFVDRIPSLTECDTTILYDFFKRVATYPPFGIKRCVKFDEKMETIKKFRNDSAHFTNMDLSDEEYEKHFSEFVSAIAKFESNIFVSLNNCLKFLSENKNQTFAHFCRNNPEEIALVLSTFEKNLLVIAKEIESLKGVVQKIEADKSRRLEILHRIDSHQEQVAFNRNRNRLPNGNLIKIPILAGREGDLNAVADCLKRCQIVNICGPPGIGKTSLALTFANGHQSRQSSDSPDGSEGYVYFHVKMQEIDTTGATDRTLKNEVGRKIGALFPEIATDLHESEMAFEILMSHARDLVNEMKLFFVLDNIDTILNAQQGNIMGNVLEELASLDESVRIITTSRDKRLDIILMRLDVINLKPISKSNCHDWLISENSHAQLCDDLISAITESCDGIPLVLKTMHSVVKRRRDISPDNLDEVRRTEDWNRLTRCLDVSFKMLTFDEVKLMKCVSVLDGNFEKSTLIEKFQKVGGDYDSAIGAFARCSDLSLIEFDCSRSEHYLHRYIKEYIVVKSLAGVQNAGLPKSYFYRFFGAEEKHKLHASVNTHEPNLIESFAEEHPLIMFCVYAFFVFLAYQLKGLTEYLAND